MSIVVEKFGEVKLGKVEVGVKLCGVEKVVWILVKIIFIEELLKKFDWICVCILVFFEVDCIK